MGKRTMVFGKFLPRCGMLEKIHGLLQKIQGTYFKISALYFKIHGLYFSQQAMCFFRTSENAFFRIVFRAKFMGLQKKKSHVAQTICCRTCVRNTFGNRPK